MEHPRLFTSAGEIETIKERLNAHPWYADSYAAIKRQVDEMLRKGVSVPSEGGYVFYDCCKRDNQTLVFDPYQPYFMYCPLCGMRYFDDPHKRAWVVRYHSWLSQMSILTGIVYQVERDSKYAAFLRRVLLDYASVYPSYLNTDNELGPTKMAQSTYMESVFIMYFAGGYDMMVSDAVFSSADRQIIETCFFRESVKTILDYDEGRNNRQAFNNAGIIAVGYLFDDQALINHALHGKNGFIRHMEDSVLCDGLWYEGDNYHFATVPSLVNIAEMSLRNGMDLYHQNFNGHCIENLFLAPLLSLQPDLTFPSRKDSRYANHFAQRWYVGLYELAYSRYRDLRFSDVLNQAYGYREAADGKFASAAGIMDIFEPEQAARDRLDWRGFLTAEPELPAAEGNFSQSVVMEGTGLAVVKRESGTYVSLDYGDYGGGHGHPDRLNLNFFSRGKRWLADFGTGNYYFDHLRWYRSSVGHNVIVVDGKPHMEKDGSCTHFYGGEGVSMMRGVIDGVAAGVSMTRTVFLIGELLLDFSDAVSADTHTYHYCLHPLGAPENDYETSDGVLSGDGYDFLKNIKRLDCGTKVRLAFRDQLDTLYISADTESAACYIAEAYGPPSEIPKLFPVILMERAGHTARFTALFESAANGGGKTAVSMDIKSDETTVLMKDDGAVTVKAVVNQDGSLGWLVILSGSGGIEEVHGFCVLEQESYAAEWGSAKRFEHQNQIRRRARETKPLAVNPLLTRDGRLCVSVQNHSPIQQRLIFNDMTCDIPAEKTSTIMIPPEHGRLIEGKTEVQIDYTAQCLDWRGEHRFQKAFAEIIPVAKSLPVDSFDYTPNLWINRPEQFRRAEKNYGGESDLSADFMVCDNGECLIVKGFVHDDRVLFDGGKYPFDNDSIQLYIDKRVIKDYDSLCVSDGVYGFLLIPPAFGEATRLKPTGAEVLNEDMLTASCAKNEWGYEVLLAISWEAIGGRPVDGSYIGFDIIVNDRDSGYRRDAQGVWSGCATGERIYLREDRHDPQRFGTLKIRGAHID